MTLSAHTIKPNKGSQRRSKRVGRGNGSGKGTTAARGMKGQRARSGGKSGNAARSFKQSLQKIPKLHGFNSLVPKKTTVSLSTLERVCENGSKVTPYFLEKVGVIAHASTGVKIVANGELKKKLDIVGCFASKAAIEAIEKAGGKMTF
ncbi:MAG: 50S ribosomal protein L15 [Candidatus Magasanikbacteria bacterium CG11_big_fil_rev_8_21_14_0_20_39_34]|uniref:Large ribosomal subunit protein uL15 n=1 Tax=Candidatus Magasanikbacteria bacterium CG11_big_fil_rev_8_21_14_0_20_39_34 TaxID=1974653 RepID=A0A2H0N3W4_9BACT|nr:MAG: 50S ribosomal protein L15 [Candidatus Magasanikbacteria bacterium CG11_big_fil_rev_8_21_14_0_20_39_34]